MVHYNLPAFAKGDCTAFLSGVARSNLQLKKGGAPDLTQAARIVLREWTTGKLPYYTDAPAQEPSVVPESDPLAELYARADGVALDITRTRKEMQKAGGLVRIVPGEVEKRKVVLETPFVAEERESGSDNGDTGEDDVDEDDDEEDEEVDGNEDEDEDDASEEDIPTPALTGKRKRIAAATTALPSKKVAFAAGTRNPKERAQARSGKPAKQATSAKPSPKQGAPAKSSLKKAVPVKVSNAKPSTKAKKDASAGAGDAYDFDQFFKS